MDILGNSSESLRIGLREGKIVVAVYGLGHVGLAISAVWLRAGATVIGVDISEEIVESINNGISPLQSEPGIPEMVRKYVSIKKFKAVTNGGEASRVSDVKIIAVPTTLSATKKCNLSAIRQALQAIAGGLKRGDLVIIESSVPPATTNKIAKQILEKRSNLKVEEDFGLAYSPERIYEGRVLEDIRTHYPKIIGGVGPKSAEAAAALYSVIAEKGVVKVTGPMVAETSKLFEGIYRDTNIALANELARFCAAIGVDFNEVREAANSQPFCHLHIPGFVGGWCIPFYPYFVLQAANERNVKLPLTSLARKTNEARPRLLIDVVDSTLKRINKRGLKGSKVAILGLTFRGDVADTRNSPSYEVIDLLLGKGIASISAYDPFITRDSALEKKGIRLVTSLDDATRGADIIIIMTDHSTFKNNLTSKDLLKGTSIPSVLVDGRNILPLGVGKTGDGISHRKTEGFNVFIRLT